MLFSCRAKNSKLLHFSSFRVNILNETELKFPTCFSDEKKNQIFRSHEVFRQRSKKISESSHLKAQEIH